MSDSFSSLSSLSKLTFVSTSLVLICVRFIEQGQSWFEELRDEHGKTALHIAARENRIDIVQEKLQEGYDINGIDLQGLTALHHACQALNWNVGLELLLQSDINVKARTRDHDTVMHFIATARIDESSLLTVSKVIEILKSKGANVNGENREGHTPLHKCVLASLPINVRLFLSFNSNINAKDQ